MAGCLPAVLYGRRERCGQGWDQAPLVTLPRTPVPARSSASSGGQSRIGVVPEGTAEKGPLCSPAPAPPHSRKPSPSRTIPKTLSCCCTAIQPQASALPHTPFPHPQAPYCLPLYCNIPGLLPAPILAWPPLHPYPSRLCLLPLPVLPAPRPCSPTCFGPPCCPHLSCSLPPRLLFHRRRRSCLCRHSLRSSRAALWRGAFLSTS